MTRTRIPLALAALTLLALTGCIRLDPTDPMPDTRTEVPWGDYDETVKERIDGLEDAKDCAGLQGEFDIADANSTATLNRTGHGNADLMGYIDEALELAGCYTS